MRFSTIFIVSTSIVFSGCLKKTLNLAPIVDAGEAIEIQLPENNISLNGTVEDKDGEIINVMWSQISGPVEASILEPSTLIATATGLEVGEYTFKLTATDNEGASVSDTVMVTVLDFDVEILTYQPAYNHDEVHIFGSETIDQTDTLAPELLGGAGTYLGTPVVIRAAVKFDLPEIADTSKVLSARLTLFSNPTPLNGHDGNANTGPDNSLLIQRITSTWNAADVTWLDQPLATDDDQIVVPHSEEDFEDIVDLDVTTLVKKMLSEGNHGFFIRLQNEAEYNFRIFCSSKYSDATKHPKLVLTVQE